MAASNVTRSIPAAQSRSTGRHVKYLKIRTYQHLHALSRGFQIVADNLERMESLGIFRGDYLRNFRGFALELQAEINHKLLGILMALEGEDACRFGKIRTARDKRLKTPSLKSRR
jgi:hypothetical protein